MFREIDAACYIMVDGDDTYPAENAREMADLVLNKQVDMVVGDRLSSTYFTEKKRPFHNMGNRLVRSSINALFSSRIKDIMTGYRAFSFQFVKSFPVLSRGFEIETEMSIHAVDNIRSMEKLQAFSFFHGSCRCTDGYRCSRVHTGSFSSLYPDRTGPEFPNAHRLRLCNGCRSHGFFQRHGSGRHY